MSQSKREAPDTGPSDAKKPKTVCSFKEKCYRRNPHHFKEYEHPHLDVLLQNDGGKELKIPDNYLEKSIVLEQLKVLRELKKPAKEVWQKLRAGESSTSRTRQHTFADKLEQSAPYNLFFTVIPESPETAHQPSSMRLTDLLCPSLGVLESSLQLNFIIDIIWLMEQYKLTNNHRKPLTILYGDEFPKMKEYMASQLPNVTPHFVKMQDPFGTHHSKMGLYYYADRSLRVHVSTANLYEEDWSVYCQAVWVSPACPPLSADAPDSAGHGPTGFKSALLRYLQHYQAPCLSEWVRRVRRADFSAVRVCLVTSVPGKHAPTANGGHLQQVGDLLSRHCRLPGAARAGDQQGPLGWHVLAQASSIGNLGANPAAWLRSALLRSLASHQTQRLPASSPLRLAILFPSRRDVLNSYRGKDGGGCLPYARSTHDKQLWLQQQGYLHLWRAQRTARTRAMPHIKSYCRVSPCHTRLAWFLLTSANISKAAWGSLNKDTSSYVRSYELGVLFLPAFFDHHYFRISDGPSDITDDRDAKLFPFVYDLPLSAYEPDDKPWTM